MDNFAALDFRADAIEEATKLIRQEKMHITYCYYSGIAMGRVFDSEIQAALRVKLANQPLLSVNELVESYNYEFVAMSSTSSPVFRFTKSKDKFLHILKQDPKGANRLFGYLLSKFLFEQMQREKLIDSFAIRNARLSFLIEFQGKLGSLLDNWWQSLTPRDELVKDAKAILFDLIEALEIPVENRDESKDAQRCLEALMAIDGIYNLRSRFFHDKLQRATARFIEQDTWSFNDLLNLLKRVMVIAFNKSMTTKRTPQGDARSISIALEALSVGAKRKTLIQEKLYEQSKAGRLGPTSTGRQILVAIESMLENVDPLIQMSKAEKLKLRQLVNSLSSDMDSLSWSDNRLNLYRSIVARKQSSLGSVKVIRGKKAVDNLVDALVSQNITPPAHVLKIQREQAIEHRARLDAKRVKEGKRPVGRPKSIRSQKFAEAMSKAFAGVFEPKKDGKD